MKWRKVRGGVQVEWVGYLIDYARFEMGITESRAKWCTTWLLVNYVWHLVNYEKAWAGWCSFPARSNISDLSWVLSSRGLLQAPGL